MQTTVLRLGLFLTLGPLFALAQHVPTKKQPTPARWFVGGRAGVTLAGVNRSAIRSFQGVPLNAISTQTVQTGHVGLLAGRALPGGWAVQTEVLYNQYGGRVDGQITIGPFNTDVSTLVRLRAVEVPVLVRRSFGRGRVGGFVNAGGFGAYSVSSTVTINARSLADLIPDVDHKLIYGLVAGAGASVRVGPGHLLLESRYSYSLGDNVDLDFGGTKLHYQIGLLSAAYVLPIN